MPNLHPREAEDAIKAEKIWGSNPIKGKHRDTNLMFFSFFVLNLLQ